MGYFLENEARCSNVRRPLAGPCHARGEPVSAPALALGSRRSLAFRNSSSAPRET